MSANVNQLPPWGILAIQGLHCPRVLPHRTPALDLAARRCITLQTTRILDHSSDRGPLHQDTVRHPAMPYLIRSATPCDNLGAIEFMLSSASLQGRVISLLRDYAAGTRVFTKAGLRNGRPVMTVLNLQGANFSGVQLEEVILIGANLDQTNFSWANLTRANFNRASLTSSNFWHATLYQAEFQQANLRGAFMAGADLSEADLRGADLSRANLRDAILTGTNLEGTNLRQAIMPDGSVHG